MNALVIDYDPFVQESRLYAVKDGQHSDYRISSSIDSLASKVIALAQETGIYSVKVSAPSAFIGEIDRQVKQLEMATYSENKISVERM